MTTRKLGLRCARVKRNLDTFVFERSDRMWDQKSDSMWSDSLFGGDASASILNSYSADVRDSFLCAGRLPRLPNFTLCDGTDNLNLPISSSSSRFENYKTVIALKD